MNRKLELFGETGSNIPHLTSSFVPKPMNHAIGQIWEDALYITPLQDILQLRPTFEGLKDPDGQTSTLFSEDGTNSNTSKLATPVLQQVNVYSSPIS